MSGTQHSASSAFFIPWISVLNTLSFQDVNDIRSGNCREIISNLANWKFKIWCTEKLFWNTSSVVQIALGSPMCYSTTTTLDPRRRQPPNWKWKWDLIIICWQHSHWCQVLRITSKNCNRSVSIIVLISYQNGHTQTIFPTSIQGTDKTYQTIEEYCITALVMQPVNLSKPK